MYSSVTSDFLEVLARPSRHFTARFKDNGTDIGLEVKNMRITSGTCGSTLAVGCAYAAYIEVTAKATEYKLEGKELYLEIGLLMDDDNYEYVPFGYWTVQKPEKANDTMTFQAVDRMAGQLHENYTTALTYPATAAAVLNELATNTGLTITCSLQTSSVTIQVPIEGVTQRGALAIIAATLLGNAWIDRTGNVQITSLSDGTEVDVDYAYIKPQPDMDEEQTVIEGVKVYTVAGQTDTWIERGSGNQVVLSDVYMTNDNLDTVKNNVMGLTYDGGSVSFMGNPLLDPSDKLWFRGGTDAQTYTLVDGSGNTIIASGSNTIVAYDYRDYSVPCMEIVQFFDGGLLTTVMAQGQFEKTEETYVVGAVTEELQRQAKEISDVRDIAEATETAFASAVIRIDGDIEDLQNQIDGNITTWFYAVNPTTSNPPASTWTTTAEKNNHLGDLYYNTDNGYVWRWMVLDNVYSWQKLSDSDIAEALAVAQAAQDTADNKRRVFVSTPTVPYDVGDLWVQGTSGDIMRCQTAKTSTGSYSASDWILASKYTDNTVANAAQSAAEAAQGTANNALTLANGKNKIYYQDSAPASGMSEGDLWFDTDGGNAIYEYKKTSNTPTYAWTLRQLGQGSIAAGSITGNEIYGNTLSAIFANLGSVTVGGANNANGSITVKDASNNTVGTWDNAGITLSKGVIKSSTYQPPTSATGNYSAAGMIIDLDTSVIRMPNTAILSNGSLYTKSGEIGPWTLSSSSLSSNTLTISSAGSYHGSTIEIKDEANARIKTAMYGDGFYAFLREYESSGNWRAFVQLVADYDSRSGYAIGGLRLATYTLAGTGTEIGAAYLYVDDSGHFKVTSPIYCSSFVGDLTGHARDDLALSGGTMTGNITFAATKGINGTDSANRTFAMIYDTGDNLWIGATSSTGNHHTGANGLTFISTGYNTTNSAGNSTIYVSVPSRSGTTWSHNYYGVLHNGNYSAYALPLSGGTLSGSLVIKNNDWTKGGSDPSAETYRYIAFTDKDGYGSAASDLVGFLYSGATTSGAQYICVRAYKNDTSATTFSHLLIMYPKTGDPYAQLNTGSLYVSNGNAYIGGTDNTSVARAVNVRNSNGNVQLHMAANGNHGIYSDIKGNWLLYATGDANSTDSALYVPRGLVDTVGAIQSRQTSGEATVVASNGNNRIYMYANSSTGNIGIYSYNSSGTAMDIISRASGATYPTFHGHARDDLPLSGGTLTGSLTVSTTSTTVERSITLSTGNVSGSLRANNGGTGGAFGLYVTKTGGTTWSTPKWLVMMDDGGAYHENYTSDAREKNIFGLTASDEAEALLREVNVVDYAYKYDKRQTMQTGIVAQQLRDVMISHGIGYRSYINIFKDDNLIYDLTAPENDVSYGIDYAKLTPVLWKGWQIHEDRIAALEAELKALKGAI